MYYAHVHVCTCVYLHVCTCAYLLYQQVECLNIYDVALDFMLMDAFDDLSSPPSALLSVIQNGWISDGIKQSVCLSHMLICTAVYSTCIIISTHTVIYCFNAYCMIASSFAS